VGSRVFSRKEGASKEGSHSPPFHKFSPLLSCTLMSRAGEGLGGGICSEGARPSEAEFSMGVGAAFRLLLKTGPEHVSSSSEGATSTTAFSFKSLAREA